MNTSKLFKIASAGLMAAAFVSTAQSGEAKGKKAAKVKCEGANSCKGTSACHTEANACAGKNGCAGSGFVWAKSDKECTALKASHNKADAPAAAGAPAAAPAAPAAPTAPAAPEAKK